MILHGRWVEDSPLSQRDGADMSGKRDYYEVLGLDRDADEKALKNAFRRLARKYHPDRSDEPDAEDRFKEIKRPTQCFPTPRNAANTTASDMTVLVGFWWRVQRRPQRPLWRFGHFLSLLRRRWWWRSTLKARQRHPVPSHRVE